MLGLLLALGCSGGPATTPEAPAPAAPVVVVEAVAAAPTCGWDDACMPTRCVVGMPATASACDESWPAPGACVTLPDGACVMRPDHPVAGPSGCDVAGCAVDGPGGRCTSGHGPGRPVLEGPLCACVADVCEPRWIEPVPCATDDDCWVSDERPLHPVARPPALRGQVVEPCSDSETTPRCQLPAEGGPGRCGLVGWRC